MKGFFYKFLGIIFLALAGLLLVKTFFPTVFFSGTNTHSQEKILFPAINGVLTEQTIAALRPVAIIVENHPDSRPQSGLNKADIVYEALAEGGITRFLAIFQSQEPRDIGPVRSAREYFLQLANMWQAAFVHVGGSSEALFQIENGVYKNIFDINEYFYGKYFNRITTRQAPHNAYTSTEKLRSLLTDKQAEGFNEPPQFKFKDDSPINIGEKETQAYSNAILANLTTVEFSTGSYSVNWQYSREDNAYQRFMGGKPHLDGESKEQLKAKNVVIQFVKVTPVLDDPLLQVDINLQTGGRAIMFLDGKFMDGKWKNTNGVIKYFDEFDQEVMFNRGQIWVELAPKHRESETKIMGLKP